jgi:hypothetical protein
MTDYTVRIGLHNADEDDYTNLNAEMEDRGFVRWIAGNNSSAIADIPQSPLGADTVEKVQNSTGAKISPKSARGELRQEKPSRQS